jgi:hypothetical protein
MMRINNGIFNCGNLFLTRKFTEIAKYEKTKKPHPGGCGLNKILKLQAERFLLVNN